MAVSAIPTVDVQELTNTLGEAITPLFWGALAAAVVIPLASAAGSWVSGKVFKGSSSKNA